MPACLASAHLPAGPSLEWQDGNRQPVLSDAPGIVSRGSHGIPGLPQVGASISQAHDLGRHGVKAEREGGRRQWGRRRDSGWGAH